MKSETPRCDRIEQLSEPISIAGYEAMELARELERELNQLHEQYRRLHSQVSGYLSGKDWLHWQKYNEPKYAPGDPKPSPAT